jgi:hypothetical protein
MGKTGGIGGKCYNYGKCCKMIEQLLSTFSSPFFGVKFLYDYVLCSAELVLLVFHPDTIIIRELLLFRILLVINIFQEDVLNKEHVRISGGSGV